MSGTLPKAWRGVRGAAPAVLQRGAGLFWHGVRVAWAEITVVATILIVAGGLWTFVTLAEEVGEGETEAFDRQVILALRSAADPSDPLGPIWFEEAVRDVTALGSTVVLTFMTLAVVGFLLLIRKRGAAALVAGSVAGGWLLGSLLKLFFERARPDLVPHGTEVYTASFPSNHAMLSAVTYLTLGVLLARVQLRRSVKGYFLALSAFLTGCVGMSRIYLGVHWPTDVLAGWALGAAWAMSVWLLALWLQRRGKVEQPSAA